MSPEELKDFLAKVEGDTSLQEKLKTAKSPVEVSGIARDHGHEFDGKINDIKFIELSDEELESFAGGLNPSDLCIISIVTVAATMKKCTCPFDR